MIESVAAFTNYLEGVRRRTERYIVAIPETGIEWAPGPSEFTVADIVRHIAAAEIMFARAVARGRWDYPGHTEPRVATVDELSRYLTVRHRETLETLATVSDETLHQEVNSLEGTGVAGWRLLMALVEHEVHHRSQLASYLRTLDASPPDIFGLGVEDVIARATG